MQGSQDGRQSAQQNCSLLFLFAVKIWLSLNHEAVSLLGRADHEGMALSIHSVRAEPSVPVSGVQIAASLVVRQAGSQQNLSDEELTAALEGASSQRYQLRFRWYRVSTGPAVNMRNHARPLSA